MKRAQLMSLPFGVLAALAVAPHASARRPAKPDAWWAGLDDPTPTASANRVVLLRAVPRGRVRVGGGTFVMGSTPAQMERGIALCEREVRMTECHGPDYIGLIRAEGMAHPVTLSRFELDRVEVTVTDYARCVSDAACAPAELPPDDARLPRGDLPITQVQWQDADAYCRWARGRLPTEAEWEYAARGAEQREFPWGNIYNPHLANHGAWAPDRSDATDGFAGLAPVGSILDGATPLGILDMAGNVAEWVADVLEVDRFGHPVGYEAAPETDPRPKTTGGGPHIVRGGSYMDGATWLRAAARDYTLSPRSSWVGFRCAADVR